MRAIEQQFTCSPELHSVPVYVITEIKLVVLSVNSTHVSHTQTGLCLSLSTLTPLTKLKLIFPVVITNELFKILSLKIFLIKRTFSSLKLLSPKIEIYCKIK